MTRVTMLGRLTAAEDRTLKGVLLPFGVPGLTNLGKVTASKGTLTVPAEVTALHASLDHLDDRDPVAAFKVVKETDEGLYAEWDVPKTHGGDRLLAEYRAGVRTGVSVELEPVQIKSGAIVSGTVVGCAFPVEPAFDTARLVAEKAEAPDVDDDTHVCDVEGCTDTDPAHVHLDDSTADTTTDSTTDTTTQGETVTTTTTASAPRDLHASATRRGNGSRLTAASITKPGDFFRLMAGAQSDRRLMAALSDIIPSDTADSEVPQWVGELWSGIPYQRKIVPLLAQAELTGLKAKGWRWVTKPAVGRYAGNKANVPSNTVEMELVERDAQRFAGAHDIDRKYRDFNDTAFFEAYYGAMGESYAKQTDLYAVEELKAEATPATLGTVPAGVSAAWAALVDAALAIVDVGTPTFALVEKSVYRELALTPTDKGFEFLSASLDLEEGQLSGFKIIPVASTAVGDASAVGLDAGEILVGAKQAASWHELGGGAPIRVEAVDMVRGGVDAGVFGYGEVIVHDPRALAIVDTNADGA